MRTRARRVFVPALLLALAGASQAGGDKSKSYTFHTPPANSLGVRSLADLHGKPVLIDFWGTR